VSVGLRTPQGRASSQRLDTSIPNSVDSSPKDSFLGSVDNPPSLHRYFYARANPLRYIDPTGHQSEEANSHNTDESAPAGARMRQQIDERLPWLAQPSQADTPPQGTVHEEGWLARAWGWWGQKKEVAKRWMRDRTGALGRKLFDPPSASAREQEIQKAFQGTATAEAAARDYNQKRKIGEGVQQVSGDVAGATGELATEGAFQYAEAQVGGRLAGALARGAGRGRQLLRNVAKDADDAIEAEVRANRRAAAAEARAAGQADEALSGGGGTPPGSGGPGGGGPRYHSVYEDGTLVVEGRQPPRLPRMKSGVPEPEPGAVGPHSRLRWDPDTPSRSGRGRGRVYQERQFDEAGNPVRDIDYTSPTYPSGRPRPGHAPPPHEHAFTPNDPARPQAGFKRGDPVPIEPPGYKRPEGK